MQRLVLRLRFSVAPAAGGDAFSQAATLLQRPLATVAAEQAAAAASGKPANLLSYAALAGCTALFGLSVSQPPDWQHVQNNSFVMDGVSLADPPAAPPHKAGAPQQVYNVFAT